MSIEAGRGASTEEPLGKDWDSGEALRGAGVVDWRPVDADFEGRWAVVCFDLCGIFCRRHVSIERRRGDRKMCGVPCGAQASLQTAAFACSSLLLSSSCL